MDSLHSNPVINAERFVGAGDDCDGEVRGDSVGDASLISLGCVDVESPAITSSINEFSIRCEASQLHSELNASANSWLSNWKQVEVNSFDFAPPPKWSAQPAVVLDGEKSELKGDTKAKRSKQEKGRTRILPSDDVIRVQDRLFYLLQPPLESVLSGKNIAFKFQPFPYQYDGIAFLYPRQFCVLADEMGLGKTMQAISAMRLLLHAREINEVLLICPKPLATNWIKEFETWAPEIPIEIIGGDQPKRRMQWLNRQIPVKVANYELLLRDIDFIQDQALHFDLVALDEAQRIKNPKSSTSRVVKSISRSRNWALTGTPIENSADDLAGIFDFLSDGLVPSGTQPHKMAAEVGDHILRRTKDEVLDDMPPKIINDAYLNLSDNQWQAYERAEKEGIVKLNRLGGQLTVQHVFELVLRLKQICNEDPLTGDSAKTDQLVADLEEVVKSGHKAIVFSQWVNTIEKISDKIKAFNPLQYHGKIPSKNRDSILDEFKNSKNRPVILMSYGTGSVGLNLQFCRYVFLYDRWWNPAVEDQAINRAHRLGSAGSVTVKRIICTSTIEERIHDVLEEKRELFEAVLGNKCASSTGLNQKEIFGLFNLEIPRSKAA